MYIFYWSQLTDPQQKLKLNGINNDQEVKLEQTKSGQELKMEVTKSGWELELVKMNQEKVPIEA